VTVVPIELKTCLVHIKVIIISMEHLFCYLVRRNEITCDMYAVPTHDFGRPYPSLAIAVSGGPFGNVDEKKKVDVEEKSSNEVNQKLLESINMSGRVYNGWECVRHTVCRRRDSC
jgi:hypothetical protein